MFEDFFDHRCNIYHTETVAVNAGYGIKTGSIKSLGRTVDIKDVPCHFHVKVSDNVRIVQDKPYSTVDGEIKLSLPYGTDIQKNDIVEDCSNGMKYRAGIPRNIHGNHHVIIKLTKEGGIESAL